MQNWMQALAAHYETVRAQNPREDLLILFDIDGTILDIRYMMLYLLQAYDQHHDTGFFSNRNVIDINFAYEELESGLVGLGVPASHFGAIREWCDKHRWSMAAILESHRPFPGVLDVIRWFQLQPNTHVGLNTSRAESLREETLCSLNKLGREYRVHFASDLLFMREATGHHDIAAAKVDGIRHFRELGYRPFAMVDNQPYNLEAVADCEPDDEILLLHAGTLFQNRLEHIPAGAVHGNVYDLTELIPSKSLPRHIQFVWQGVNNEAVLSEFLRSNIRWADLSGLTEPCVNACQLDSETSPMIERQSRLIHDSLQAIKDNHRGIRIGLGADKTLNTRILDLLQSAGIAPEDIWFHADIELLDEAAFRYLAETHPGSVIEVPVDFLAPLIMNGTQLAESVLDRLSEWGVNRFALSWHTPQVRKLQELLDHWGFETTICHVRELQSFLQAVLLNPRAISSEFNFPKWQSITTGKRRVYDVRGELLKQA